MENSREGEENNEVTKRSRKAMHLIGLIKMYKELVLTVKEAGKHVRRSAIAW